MANQTITGTKTIIKHVTEPEATLEYRVSSHAHLYLVVTVWAEKNHAVEVKVHLMGKKSSATVVGLVAGRADASVSFHTLQHHAAVETTSNLLVKSVLADHSFFSYEGSITVDPKAQKTDAYQRNENLLLDSTAKSRSEPALEILANDVRCTHGATIGTLNEEELWYLATRGITGALARDMIARGFLQSAFGGIIDTMIREKIERQIEIPSV